MVRLRVVVLVVDAEHQRDVGALGGGRDDHFLRTGREVFARALAVGERARGGTAYVTLEPCAERSAGGTSCAQRLVEAGVQRVVIACADGSRYASGRGREVLEQAGVIVEVGILEGEAARLYADYAPRAVERPD